MSDKAIQNGWKDTNLGQMANLIKDSWKPGDANIDYLGLEHINVGTLTINSIGESSQLNSNKFRFKAGDILFGKLRPYFRKVVIPDFDGVCSTDIWVVRAKENYYQKYLFYFMANPVFIDKSMGANIGTHMPRADWRFLEQTNWLVPVFLEQKSIAAVLSSFDNKIELLRNQNQTMEEMTQTLFKEWFVDYRFPGAGKMVDSELGKIPEGWRVDGLSSIAEFLNGLALQKFPPINEFDVLPVIKIKELNNGISDQTDKASKNIPKKYIVENGDVLFSWSGSLELVLWEYGKGALNQHLFKVTSEIYPKWFYYHWINYYLQHFRQIASSKATTMGHIQRHHLDEALVAIPEIKVLQKGDEILNPLIEKIISNNNQIQTLTQLRDSLLPKLMSGEVRVKMYN